MKRKKQISQETVRKATKEFVEKGGNVVDLGWEFALKPFDAEPFSQAETGAVRGHNGHTSFLGIDPDPMPEPEGNVAFWNTEFSSLMR